MEPVSFSHNVLPLILGHAMAHLKSQRSLVPFPVGIWHVLPVRPEIS